MAGTAAHFTDANFINQAFEDFRPRSPTILITNNEGGDDRGEVSPADPRVVHTDLVSGSGGWIELGPIEPQIGAVISDSNVKPSFGHERIRTGGLDRTQNLLAVLAGGGDLIELQLR